MVEKILGDKREILFVISALILIASLIYVFAYPSMEFSKFAVAAYTGTFNSTEDVTYSYNFTINNTAGLKADADQYNITEVNVSLPGNIVFDVGKNATNTKSEFTNYSNGVLNWRNVSGANAGYVLNGSNSTGWFSFNATAATPGKYTINITVLHGSVNTAGGWNTTTFNFNVTVNDTTAPDILATNFIRPTSNFNYSGNFLLNGTITDNYKNGVGINYVNVSVINATGVYRNYTASNLSGNYWNFTIDTTGFGDGVYNITITVNDTSNNKNSTNITLLRFDNTIPAISFSCTPANVHTGDTVTCSCTGTDSTAGVNSTTYTASPSTSNTGSHTETCSVVDTAGNSQSASSTFVVELSVSGSSSSGSSSGTTTSTFTYSKTIPQTGSEFSEIQKIETSSFSSGGLAVKEKVTVKLNNEVHYVGIRELTDTSATVEIASDPVQVKLDVGEDAKVDVDGDGYYDIYVKLNSITASKADVTISYLHEAKGEGAGAVDTGGEVISGGEEEVPESGFGWNWTWIIIGAVIVIALIIWFSKKN